MSLRNDSLRRGYRSSRLEKSVAEIFEASLLPSLNDPLLEDLHVISVEVASNLSCIRVLLARGAAYSCSADEIEVALSRIEGRMRAEIAAELRIKRMPHLRLKFLPLPLRQGGAQ